MTALHSSNPDRSGLVTPAAGAAWYEYGTFFWSGTRSGIPFAMEQSHGKKDDETDLYTLPRSVVRR